MGFESLTDQMQKEARKLDISTYEEIIINKGHAQHTEKCFHEKKGGKKNFGTHTSS